VNQSERKEIVIGPTFNLDETTPDQYVEAIGKLERFRDFDIRNVCNIQDLELIVPQIHSALLVVITARGEIDEHTVDWEWRYDENGKEDMDIPVGVIRMYVLKKSLGDKKSIVIQLNHPNILIDGYAGYGKRKKGRYSLSLPPSATERVDPDNQVYFLHATSARHKNKDLFPTIRKQSIANCRGFARILRQSLRELIEVLPEPARVPEAFRNM